jgi:BlaI family penicillinase repressor
MPPPFQDITEAELGIMQALWEHGQATIRQLTDRLHPRGGPSRYATVQKLLERLEAKGFVARDRSLYVHRFAAKVSRDELIGRRLRAVAESLCGGSLTPILSHLAKAERLTDDERRALRALIEGPEPGSEDDSGTEPQPRSKRG